MFLFKKIISHFLYPVSLLLMMQLAGLFLLWFTKKQRPGRRFITAASLFLVLCTCFTIPQRMLGRLESQYAALVSPKSNASLGELPVNWVVVLGGGHVCAPERPALSQLNEASLGRLVEGIRIYRELPGSRLIVSGGSVFDQLSDAEVLAKAAMEMGVPVEDILQEHGSRDTEEQALFIARMVGTDRFILVTSAYHMPRSMALFRGQGMTPVPAPTNYQSTSCPEGTLARLVPDPRGFERATCAVHEYLGMAWSKLRGRI